MLRAAAPLFLLCALQGAAAARSSASFPYPLDEVYSTAIRFLRIDRGCAITDRDPHAAFLLFECKEGGKARRGALEIFRNDDAVRAQLTLHDEPSYMEVRLLELLDRKLREERGPAPTPRKRPPPPPDGGASP